MWDVWFHSQIVCSNTQSTPNDSCSSIDSYKNIYWFFFVFQIATEGLRIEISPGISQHMAKLIRICMNEDPGKRPSFDQVITVLEKMKKTAN